MESVRLNIANDLLQSTELASNTIENNTILGPIDKVYFVICNSCYWCASYFGIDNLESLSGSSSHVLDCRVCNSHNTELMRVCNSHNTELMPISNDESFRIKYSLTNGMELEFYKSNKVVPRQESVNVLVRPG